VGLSQAPEVAAAEHAGATYRKVALFDDIKLVSEEDIVNRIKKAITPKTRLIAMTHARTRIAWTDARRTRRSQVGCAMCCRRRGWRADVITDFVRGADKLAIWRSEFGINAANPFKLQLGVDPQANAPGPVMLFETDTGAVSSCHRHGEIHQREQV